MKLTLPTVLACVFCSLAVGQTRTDKRTPALTSICSIAKNPETFEGRWVSVRRRYNVNWEWGAWIEGEPCHQAIAVALANGYTAPAYLSNLYIEKNDSFHTFERQQGQLCGGSWLCDFDYIEADFTGVLVGPGHFPKRPLEHAPVLIVVNIAGSKLHRNEHPMGTDPPQLPSEIPEQPQR